MSDEPEVGNQTLRDGTVVRYHEWVAAQPVGRLLIVHGLGEHSRRYARLAADLTGAGVSVRAFDLRGHGGSTGRRGILPAGEAVLYHDLRAVFDAYAAAADDLPFLLGHSLGGLIAAESVTLGLRPRGLVLSSPALATPNSGADRATAATLRHLLPGLAVGNRLRVDAISHDPAVVAAYRADPLVHDRVNAALAHYTFTAGARVIAAAPRWQVPTLVQFAGRDQLVDPAGSRRFLAMAPPQWVTGREYADLYHEIYNETTAERSAVVTDLIAWLRDQLT